MRRKVDIYEAQNYLSSDAYALEAKLDKTSIGDPIGINLKLDECNRQTGLMEFLADNHNKKVIVIIQPIEEQKELPLEMAEVDDQTLDMFDREAVRQSRERRKLDMQAKDIIANMDAQNVKCTVIAIDGVELSENANTDSEPELTDEDAPPVEIVGEEEIIEEENSEAEKEEIPVFDQLVPGCKIKNQFPRGTEEPEPIIITEIKNLTALGKTEHGDSRQLYKDAINQFYAIVEMPAAESEQENTSLPVLSDIVNVGDTLQRKEEYKTPFSYQDPFKVQSVEADHITTFKGRIQFESLNEKYELVKTIDTENDNPFQDQPESTSQQDQLEQPSLLEATA